MCLFIKKEGIFTSLQGLGELGLQRYGINPRGAMDRAAVRILNTLLGNDQTDSVLELHFPAGNILFEEDASFAIGGADFGAELDTVPVPAWTAVPARRSQELRFGRNTFGSRGYLAVRGGLTLNNDHENAGGSGTSAARFETIRLKTGSGVARASRLPESPGLIGPRAAAKVLPQYSRSPVVRVIPGGEFDRLREDAKAFLIASSFKLSNDSNRMGFRLQGPPLFLDRPIEMVSSAVNFGTIQLLPDGQLVVLMADHQTSGGYPRIATVISADLPLLAQLSPGDSIDFRLTDSLTAEQAATAFDLDLRWLRTGVELGRYWQ